MRDIDELMQLAVDGTATPQDLEELRLALDRSAEGRADYEALQRLVKQLESFPMLDSGLTTPQIAAGLPKRQPRRHAIRKPLFAFAYAAAAVIIIAIAIDHAAPPQSNSSATMVRLEAEWPVVARAAHGTARLTIRGNGEEFVADAIPPGPLDFDRDKLQQIQPNRFRRQPGARGPAVIRLSLPDNQFLSATVDLR